MSKPMSNHGVSEVAADIRAIKSTAGRDGPLQPARNPGGPANLSLPSSLNFEHNLTVI